MVITYPAVSLFSFLNHQLQLKYMHTYNIPREDMSLQVKLLQTRHNISDMKLLSLYHSLFSFTLMKTSFWKYTQVNDFYRDLATQETHLHILPCVANEVRPLCSGTLYGMNKS